MKYKYVQYYVEGQDEKRLIDELKTNMQCIKTGKVQVFNVIQNQLGNMHLMQLKQGTLVVLVFDTDKPQTAALKANIDFLKSCNRVSDVICITQVKNLEDELLRSCNGIRQIKDLLGSKSNKEYKADLIRVHNLAKKLKEKGFDISRFWALQPGGSFSTICNDADLIKI